MIDKGEFRSCSRPCCAPFHEVFTFATLMCVYNMIIISKMPEIQEADIHTESTKQAIPPGIY